jgi:eukaryotic-like serine/threonine-protein kinase
VVLCQNCGNPLAGSGERCGTCGRRRARTLREPPGLRRASRSTPVVVPSQDAPTAPVVFAPEPAVPAPGKGPLPLVAQFPAAAGAAGGPPLLESVPEGATVQLHSSMLPPSMGQAPDGAVTEMLPAYALPFELSAPPEPLPRLPRPHPPGPPLSERMRRPTPRRLPRRRTGEYPRLFGADLPRERPRPKPAAPAAPEVPTLFQNQTAEPRSSLPLVALALAGLVTGLAGGYWLMEGREPPPAAVAPPAGARAKPPAAPASPDEVEPASLVAGLKPGGPPLTVVRAEGDDAAGQVRLAALTAPAEAHCPEGMRFVAGGAFDAGSAQGEKGRGFEERALAPRTVGSFCIDAHEYPNRPGTAPVVALSWEEAQRACGMLGKRLCAEDEWEKACKGPEGRRFAYGDSYDPDACNTQRASGEDRTLQEAGLSPRCRSGYGVMDLSGNVAEWTATASGQDRIVKGGAFDRPDYAARCAARKNGAPGARSVTVGFRCCAAAKQ